MNLLEKLKQNQLYRQKAIQQRQSFKRKKFQFTFYEIAFAVRQIMYQLVIKFDENSDQSFQQKQIKQFLTKILKQNESEVQYFIRNVFRYDSNKDGQIQYDQLVNFVMEQHLGQMAIQRLHRKKMYHQGSKRIMNCKQFLQTIKYALSFVRYQPNPSQVQSLFSCIDLDKDGFISYQDYFKFLIQYFGSKSVASGVVTTNTVIKQIASKTNENTQQQYNIVQKYAKYQNQEALIQDPSRVIQQVHQYLQNKQITFEDQTRKGLSPSKKSQNNSVIDMMNSNIKNQSDISYGYSASGKKQMSQSKYSVLQNLIQSHVVIQKSIKKQQQKQQKQQQHRIIQELKQSQQNTNKNVIINEQQIIKNNKSLTRLVYSQLKLILISFDSKQNETLRQTDLWNYMRRYFNYTQINKHQVFSRLGIINTQQYTYKQSAKLILKEQTNIISSSKFYQDEMRILSCCQFSQLCLAVCSLVRNTPIVTKFIIYYNKVQKQGKKMTVGIAKKIINQIFQSL